MSRGVDLLPDPSPFSNVALALSVAACTAVVFFTYQTDPDAVAASLSRGWAAYGVYLVCVGVLAGAIDAALVWAFAPAADTEPSTWDGSE